MEENFYRLIDFPSFDTKNGILTMIQKGETNNDALPFEVRKVLVIRGMKEDDARGGHTHHITQQLLFCISGSCTVNLDNGKEKKTVVLDKPDQGLLLYPYVWHTMENFNDQTILLVLADTPYDEKEYIRNYDDFIRYTKEKNV